MCYNDYDCNSNNGDNSKIIMITLIAIRYATAIMIITSDLVVMLILTMIVI